jgi:hypothetical protein
MRIVDEIYTGTIPGKRGLERWRDMEHYFFDTFGFTAIARVNAALRNANLTPVGGAESGVFSYKMSQLTGNYFRFRSVSKRK